MFLLPFDINNKLSVAEIVAKDFRTAEVFRKHGIGYCCGGKWPVDIACEMQGVDMGLLNSELKKAIRTIHVSNQLDFNNWDISFLIDYIINVHHGYLKNTFPITQQMLNDFVKEHGKKFTYLPELENQFENLLRKIMLSMEKEEEVIFPYIRQLIYAHKNKEPYAALFVRTLRKPVEEIMFKGHEIAAEILFSIRKLTNSYTTPENVCTSHKVVIAKLKELDNDLAQHLYLEQSILFPRAIAIEQEVLQM